MPTPLEELAPVPHAPHPPEIEDVLGPPPHAPRIGRRGGAPVGSLGRRARGAGGVARPPAPPHLAKSPEEVARDKAVSAAPAKAPPPVVVKEKEPRQKKPETPNDIGGHDVLPDAEYLRDQYNARASLQQRRLERANERARLAAEAKQRARAEAQAAKQARKDEGEAAKQTKRATRDSQRAERSAQRANKESGFSPEIRAKRAQQYAEMKASLDAIRGKSASETGDEGEATP